MKRNMKLIVVWLLILLIIMLSACGENADITNKDDVTFSNMLPDFETVVDKEKIEITDPDGGTCYYIKVDNPTDADYLNLREAVIDKGYFIYHIKYDDQNVAEWGATYSAGTEDNNYRISISYAPDEQAIYINCFVNDKIDDSQED